MNHANALLSGSFSGFEQNTARAWNADGGIDQNNMTTLSRGNGTPSRLRAAIWRSLTLITCPCCIPIWIVLLSGTVAGALLTKNLFFTVVLFLVAFLVCFWKALRSYDSEPDGSFKGDRDGPR